MTELEARVQELEALLISFISERVGIVEALEKADALAASDHTVHAEGTGCEWCDAMHAYLAVRAKIEAPKDPSMCRECGAVIYTLYPSSEMTCEEACVGRIPAHHAKQQVKNWRSKIAEELAASFRLGDPGLGGFKCSGCPWTGSEIEFMAHICPNGGVKVERTGAEIQEEWEKMIDAEIERRKPEDLK